MLFDILLQYTLELIKKTLQYDFQIIICLLFSFHSVVLYALLNINAYFAINFLFNENYFIAKVENISLTTFYILSNMCCLYTTMNNLYFGKRNKNNSKDISQFTKLKIECTKLQRKMK